MSESEKSRCRPSLLLCQRPGLGTNIGAELTVSLLVSGKVRCQVNFGLEGRLRSIHAKLTLVML